MSSRISMNARESDPSMQYVLEKPTAKEMIRAGSIGGGVGGIVIWIYEALVWVGAQHLMPLSGIPPNPDRLEARQTQTLHD